MLFRIDNKWVPPEGRPRPVAQARPADWGVDGDAIPAPQIPGILVSASGGGENGQACRRAVRQQGRRKEGRMGRQVDYEEDGRRTDGRSTLKP